jgi:hypothetical protein
LEIKAANPHIVVKELDKKIIAAKVGMIAEDVAYVEKLIQEFQENSKKN